MDNRRTAVLDSLSDILKRALAGTPAERMGRQAYRFLRRHAATELLSERYDRLTVEIMHQCLSPDSNTVDAGCHNGTLLRHAIARAPLGQHFAFEPLPHLATRLRAKFPGVQTYAVALSDGAGEATFHHVLSDEALSGLQRHAVEAERRHLARELHDEVGQALTGPQRPRFVSSPSPPNDWTRSFPQSVPLPTSRSTWRAASIRC